jgi:hypothetical protein
MEHFGLNNEEIVFLYKTILQEIDRYNLIVEKRGIYNELEIPEMGFISVFKTLNDETIDEILESPHFKFCIQIEKQLSNVVDMIEESLPEEYEKIDKIFKDLEE